MNVELLAGFEDAVVLLGLCHGYHPIGKALPGSSQVGCFLSGALGRARNRQDRGRGAGEHRPPTPQLREVVGFGNYGFLEATANGLPAILSAAKENGR